MIITIFLVQTFDFDNNAFISYTIILKLANYFFHWYRCKSKSEIDFVIANIKQEVEITNHKLETN